MDDLELRECYRILGIPMNASLKEVHQAYWDKVQIYHPDRFAHNRRLQKKAQEDLKIINLVYEKIKATLEEQTKQQLSSVFPNASQSNEVPTTSSNASTTAAPNTAPETDNISLDLEGKQSTLQKTQYWLTNHLKSLQKANFWATRNKWFLFSAPLILLVALPQAHAYLRYKDFPIFSDPKLLVTRLPSSLYLERTLTGVSNKGKKIFRSDGQALAILSDDSVQIWNFRTGELLKGISVQQLRPQDSTEDEIIGMSPDFKYLVTRHDQRIKVWDLNNLKQSLQTLILENGETIVKLSSDFKYLVTRHDQQVKVWDLNNLKQSLQTLILENGETIEKLSLDFKYLVTRLDQEVKVWSLSNLNQPPRKLNLGDFSGFEISEDFKYVSSSYEQVIFRQSSGLFQLPQKVRMHIVKIWSLKTGEILNTFESMDKKNGFFINVSRREILDPHTGKIYHFQTSPGLDKSFSANSVNINQNHQIAVLITAPTGKFLKDYFLEKGVIKIYQLDSGKLLRTIPGSYKNVEFLEVTPDGKFIIVYSRECRPVSGEREREINAFSGTNPFAVQQKQKYCDYDYETRVYRRESQEVDALLTKTGTRHYFSGFNESFKSGIPINSDGKTAALNEGNNIKFVDLNTGKTTHTFIDSGISNLTFSPDGQYLISKSDGKIRVWRVPK